MDGKSPPTQSFNCPACDMPVPVRGMGRASVVVCSACGTIIDAADPRLRIIQRFQQEMVKPLIPLGTRGKIKDTEYEIIGFMVRCDETGNYPWEEYLLLNPYKGFAWLVQSLGHWNFLQQIKDDPGDPTSMTLVYQGKSFRHFLADKPRVVSVVGEFYWEVSTGDQSITHDFICPPYLLSSDESQGEVNWSYGQYMHPHEIRKAFDFEDYLPKPAGIAMNQPNPWWERAVFSGVTAAIMILILAVIHSMFAPGPAEYRYKDTFVFDPTSASAAKMTTAEFKVTGRTTNLAVDIEAEVDNSWLDVALTLVNKETGKEEDADAEVAYYHGYDSDGAWTEGGKKERFYFVGVEPGTYVLTGDVSSGTTALSTIYTLSVTQSVSVEGNLFLALLAICAVPIVSMLGAAMFESARWNNAGDD